MGLFELLPVITPQNQETQVIMFKILWDYALFAFSINLLRELVKDLEDIDGDYKTELNTLPIALGRERTSKIVFALSLIPLLAIIYYTVTYLYKYQLTVGYFVVFIIAPLIYASIKIFSAETKADYHHVSNMLKLVLLTGILSLLLYQFNLQ